MFGANLLSSKYFKRSMVLFVVILGLMLLLPFLPITTTVEILYTFLLLVLCCIDLGFMFKAMRDAFQIEIKSNEKLVNVLAEVKNPDKTYPNAEAPAKKNPLSPVSIGLVGASIIFYLSIVLLVDEQYHYPLFYGTLFLASVVQPFFADWRKRFKQKDIQPETQRRKLFQKSFVNIAVYGIFVGFTLLLENMDTLIEDGSGVITDDLSTGLTLLSFFFIPLGLLLLFTMLPFMWVYRPFRRANYDTALNRTEIMSSLGPLIGMMCVDIYFQARRYIEAEELLREQIESQKLFSIQYESMNMMGLIQMELGNFAEAKKYLETAIEMKPNRGEAYDSLAEVILRTGGDLNQALELADKAVELKKPSLLGRFFQDEHSLAIHHANRAWILALLGRHFEAEDSLAKSLKYLNSGHQPARADCYYRLGMANRALGKEFEAQDYFQKALELSKNGRASYLAQQELAGRLSP